MHDDIPVIEDKPAFFRLPFHAPFFLMFLFGRLEYALGERVKHTVTGAIANDEIIGKRCDVLDVEKQNVFALFVLQDGNDLMGKFECVQISPLSLSL
jgi:hypothetical protein